MHDNWVVIFVFALTLLGGIIIKIFRSKKKKSVHTILPPPGGTTIVDCIEPGKSYEVVDNAVKLVFRQNFNEGATRGLKPVIIDAGVFFYSYLVANNRINVFLFSGFEIYLTNLKSLMLKSGTAAAVAGILLNSLGSFVSFSVLGGLVAAITVAVAASNHLNCDNFLRELPQTSIEKLGPAQTAVFFDEPQDRSQDRVFIMDQKQTTIYVPQETEYESCVEKVTEVDVEVENINPLIPWQKTYRKTEAISRKCYTDRNYVPLKARTKTLADLKKDDVAKQTEMTNEYLQQYEKKPIKSRIDD